MICPRRKSKEEPIESSSPRCLARKREAERANQARASCPRLYPVLTRKAQSLTFDNYQNQAALKTLRRVDTPANQECIKRILNAIKRLAARQVQVQLRWVPGHRGVEGNELAEHGTRETAPIRYLSAVNNQLQKQVHERWTSNTL